ncbi:DNA cytosine methyltransferase [Priestia megaterium]|uniref:DNA cytosine methyltransferase n=1 Tax=Priestia megaterium TaxID=1404 RepID=UPI002E250496|nr:DNA cytosine methyltransferase [Priestia megaterium]
MKKPIAIDLFCGAGGMSEGMLQAGFHIVFSSDINKDVQKTYMNRHEQLGLIQGYNTYFKRSDIKNLNKAKINRYIQKLKIFERKKIPEIDAIFGGPPCQGFSRAGRRDKGDPRNALFKEYIRIVDELKPKYVVMENVEGFLDTKLDEFKGHSGKRYGNNTLVSEILKEEFSKLKVKYNTIGPKVIDASNFGVPQRRKRVIFIAYRHDQKPPQFPMPITLNDKVTVGEALKDLAEDQTQLTLDTRSYESESRLGRTPKIDGGLPNYNGQTYNHELSTHTPDIKERFSLYRQGENKKAVIKRIKSKGINLENYPSLLDNCARKTNRNRESIIKDFLNGDISDDMFDILLTKKNSRSRLSSNDPSPTIVTLPDDYIHPFENRILSVREMARLQSFDDSFEFLGKRTTGGNRRKVEVPQYTQVGNAVPPLLAKAIAKEIDFALKQRFNKLKYRRFSYCNLKRKSKY